MMVLTMKFKRNVACAGNFGVVISKLYYKQELCPIILLLIHKSINVSFYYVIEPFRLPVYLKIKCDEKLLLESQEVTE